MTKSKNNRAGFYLKLALALIFLVNPIVKIFDILPDFLSAVIIIGFLREFCERAPGFEEAKNAFLKVGVVSALKIPALLIMAFVRSNDTSDNDIVTLFSFIFAVFEGILLIFAIKKLFDALFHIGMRGVDSAISRFPVSGQKLLMRPEALRLISYIFVIVRSVSCALPEMILLGTSDRIADPIKIYNAWALYPKVLTVCLIITLVFGIAVAFLFFKYISAIKKENSLRPAVGLIHNKEEQEEIEAIISAKSLISRLKLLMISSLFVLDLSFESTENIDILPNFIYGIILFIAVSRLFEKSKAKTVCLIFTGLYSITAGVYHFLNVDFLSQYNYTSLIHKAAKDAFIPVLSSAAAEFVLLILCTVMLGILLYNFEKKYIGTETLQRLSAENNRKAKQRASAFSILGMLSALAKFLCIVFEFNQVTSSVVIKGQARIITTSFLPWFDSVSFVITLLFIAYSFYYLSSLAEDIELKYS